MVDWQSPATVASTRETFHRLIFTFFGLYAWEFLRSLDFDWRVLTRRAEFKWPFIFYLANRYFMLTCMIAALALKGSGGQDPDACRGLLVWVNLSGHLALGLASANLATRTIAIWNFNIYVTSFLVVATLVQWVVIIIGAQSVRVDYSEQRGCYTTKADNMLLPLFVYCMIYDLVVLLLSLYRLRVTLVKPFTRHSGIGTVLIAHGMGFFVVALICNIVEVVFLVLDLNTSMNTMFIVPAEVLSTVVACRAVRSLASFRYLEEDPTGYNAPDTRISTIAFHKPPQRSERYTEVGETATTVTSGFAQSRI